MKIVYSSIFACVVLAMVALGGSASPGNRLFVATQLQPYLSQGSKEEVLQREWGFLIEGYSIRHQGGNKLNISLRCTPKNRLPGESAAGVDSPDSSTIYYQTLQFLNHYPNEQDYWELVNRNLTETILQANPAIASITTNLEVLPTQQTPYTRSTTVTRTDDGRTLESWSFITGQVTIRLHGEHRLNLRVKYRYRDGVSGADYPDFIPIYERVEQFLSTYADPTDSWETMNHNLVDTVLKEYPVMDSFTSKLEVKPTEGSPYHFFTTITRSQLSHLSRHL
jgi:hypothetical protein